GYVVATAASLLIGRPVKWVEDRTENLISTGFARDFHMTGDLALDKNGKMLALRVHLDSDNGAFFADAQPTKFKAGLFHIVTGSRCRGASPEGRGHGDRRCELHRGRRRGAWRRLRHSGSAHVRQRRASRPPHRQGAAQDGY